MIINTSTGLISTAQPCLSPNYDDRPPFQEIDLLVIHGISLPPGEFGGQYVQALFLNQLDPSQHPYFKEVVHLKVSSHLFICRKGELWQFVPFTKRAWHAGKSSHAGRPDCNNFSIGIELEGTDWLPYTQEQYAKLAQLSCAIIHTYPKITLQRIVGHCDIAPERKTDPGPAFDWQYYRLLVEQKLLENQGSQKTDIQA
jgi:N-acetyl-anhydromuramoyl-L-alanine amidase